MQARVEELSIENEHLRALANATSTIDGPRPLGARVIGRTGQPLTRLLTIDRGANHGVARGDGVIAEDGIVGVVLAVGRYSSDVLVMTDPTSAIDVVVQHSRARGIIRGRGDDDKYAGVVEDFDRLRDVKPGDAVVTSGIGARFPVGMMVGNIIDIDDAETASASKTAHRPLHHRLFLQRMPARLQHRNRHGPAPAPRASFAARAVDRRPPAQDHRKHEAEEDAAGMDVVLVQPQKSTYTPGDSGV
jgi:rod shape-determining protein MreC